MHLYKHYEYRNNVINVFNMKLSNEIELKYIEDINHEI